MDRRHFLRTGALGGGGLVALSGCSTTGLGAAVASGQAPPMSDTDVRAFLAKLESQMDGIQQTEPMDGLLTGLKTNRKKDDFERGEDLVRKTLRSLLLAGSFSDLPVEGRAHPAVQKRMFDGMHEMDEAATGMRDFMAALTPTERADMSRTLRHDPGLAMKVVGSLDTEAEKIGVSSARRLSMRNIATHVATRMKQSSGLFLDDCVSKVDKIAKRDVTVEALQRSMIAQMGADEFFRARDEMDLASHSWKVAGIHGNSDAATSELEHAPEPERVRRGTPLLTVGGVLMGMTLVYVGVGLLLLVGAGSIVGAFILTHGGLVLIGGLVTLIMGGVRRANS